MEKIFSTAGRLAKREEELRKAEVGLSDMSEHTEAISGFDRGVFLAKKHLEKFSETAPAFDAETYAEFRRILASAGIKHLLAYDLPEKDPRNPYLFMPSAAEEAAAAAAGLPVPAVKMPTEEDIAKFLMALRQIPDLLLAKKADIVLDMRAQERERRRVTKARQSVHRLAIAYATAANPL